VKRYDFKKQMKWNNN